MFTREQINELLKPWGSSLDERPIAVDGYAYGKHDHMEARKMANNWVGDYYSSTLEVQALADFICHQSDVIEMLAHALSFANKKLQEK